MKKRYGSCICHDKLRSLNAKGLCPIGAKEAREKSAQSKGLTIKKKEHVKQAKQRLESGDFRQNTGTSKVHANKCRTILQKNEKKIDGTFKKAKINPISKDKAAEIALLGAIKKQKIEVQGKVCEMCGKHGEVDLFHIIRVGDKKHSTNPINLLLCCRFHHLAWGANDWSKIIKFKNFDEIMERLKSLDEGKYWKLKHKIDEYKNGNRRI